MTGEKPTGSSESDLVQEIHNWRSAAIAGAVLSAAASLAVAIWVFTGELPADSVGRARSFIPFGALMVAAVTLTTIVWRAKLTEQQTLLRQEQIAAAERVRVADLLQKGVELLSSESEANQMGGIVSLEAVATAADYKMAVNAMRILASYLQENFSDWHGEVRCGAALSALKEGFMASEPEQVRSVVGILRFEAREKFVGFWLPVLGVQSVSYKGGFLPGGCIDRMQDLSIPGPTIHLHLAAVAGDALNIGFSASDCRFVQCNFSGVAVEAFLQSNKFVNCDFSGVHFEVTDGIDLREGENFYFDDDPPVVEGGCDWSSVLISRVR